MVNAQRGLVVVSLLSLSLACEVALAAEQPIFRSAVVTPRTEGNAVAIDADIRGARGLWLVVTDAGNGYGCDWADWAEPRVVGPDGEKMLTELRWKSARSDWGQVRVGRNAGGGELRIDGKAVPYGIGTHANSIIAFELPEGVERFVARGGLDDGGARQGACGDGASVQFMVFTEPPPRNVTRASSEDAPVHDPEQAVANLDIADGLEATLFISEPTIVSPTNLDIDARGRVWLCEVMNYRGNNGRRPEGDRILIFEDTDGDGRADETKVFYQGRDIDSAMGICVLGTRIIVSASPWVFIFHDEDGDDRPDRKEVFFSRTGQPQHDHSAHSFIFGPDGKLYWNFGNTGQQVHDRDGNPVVDLAGNTVVDNGRPYFGGMAFRCNMDGSGFEVLGHNFRNNYELTVDSFGTVWQSDNDDDGNRGVRINYVMEGGNFGYRDERTGAGWSSPRTGMEEDVPLRHWHLNDPGVVPNLLQTGAGSPTGITVYEGDLLPDVFRGQVIHCDAGPSVVRAYPVERSGAGYTARIVNVAEGTRNRWFRPADVCVAPDGSLFVTDWYDPGVGGHAQRDLDRGRVFRIAPPGKRYEVPRFDFESTEGAIEALKNPAGSVRYLAWTALNEKGRGAEAALLELYRSNDPRHRARALWLLSKIEGRGAEHVERALADADPDIRITAIRAARQLDVDMAPIIERLAADPSAQVRRECAVALRHLDSPRAPALWTKLAQQYDGEDRWYLEALGIAARGRWDAFLGAWLEAVGDGWDTWAGRQIVWRSRATVTPKLLGNIIADVETRNDQLARAFRAMDFLEGESKSAVLASLAFAEHGGGDRERFIVNESLDRLKGFDPKQAGADPAAVERAIAASRGSRHFVGLVTRFSAETFYPELLALAQRAPDAQESVEAARALLSKGKLELFEAALAGTDAEAAANTARVLGNAGDGRAVGAILATLKSEAAPLEVRRQAARAAGRFRAGADELIALARKDELDETLRGAAAFQLNRAPWDDVRKAAVELFPLPGALKNAETPAIADLLGMRADARRGREVYGREDLCVQCHRVGDQGKEVGPDLSGIGAKLSRESLFESILYPSAGIAHSYESWTVVLKSGDIVIGIITSETDDMLSIKTAEALVREVKKSDIAQRTQQDVSLMPADLQQLLTARDLADLVAFLERQRG